ncbi:hypothetical protein JQ604_35920 [Bradyrhizobium jicamae]|uniref:hypothetical protein n=1 Tax=Bradyrhizobium jicamae TaxID=280332 RepID=UPI001BAD323E|nr:hypothetical protein [Bradyrhizobium jicamae]MBR0757598.1 hypothetical protein [Bradyrhizobium jicamae]
MRRLMQASLGLLAWSLLQTSPASAQLKGNAEYICRNGYFPRESTDYRLAKIKGAAGDRIYFHGDTNERCPDDQACRLKTYVIPNDDVIVSRTFGKFACSWFQPRKGSETVGWIETDRLAWQGDKRPPEMRDWLGEWRADGNVIRIATSKEAGQLAIKGEAIWGSGSRTHVGELDYDAKPSGDKMKFGDGTDELDCQVTMQLLGKLLVVGDNLHCGGVNVSFSGVYQRGPKR